MNPFLSFYRFFFFKSQNTKMNYLHQLLINSYHTHTQNLVTKKAVLFNFNLRKDYWYGWLYDSYNYFHAINNVNLSHISKKAMATHSSTLAWKIPWTEEPDRLQSMGLLRVGHHWATSLSLFTFMHWRRKWQPTPVFLPGESQGWGALKAAVYGVAQSQTRLKWLSSSIFRVSFNGIEHDLV